MSHVITCPSGLTGRIRGMKVRKEGALTNCKLAKSGGQVDALLGAYWDEMLDPGPTPSPLAARTRGAAAAARWIGSIVTLYTSITRWSADVE